MALHNGFVRKRVWVNGLIQGKVLTYISIYWVLYHFLLLHATFIYNIYQSRDSMLVGEDALPITVLYGQFLTDHAGFVCCALFVLPVILFDALWFSHRIVGPLYRIRIALQQMAAGIELSPIRLRKGDYLNDVAQAVNNVHDHIERLQNRRMVASAGTPQSHLDGDIDVSAAFGSPDNLELDLLERTLDIEDFVNAQRVQEHAELPS